MDKVKAHASHLLDAFLHLRERYAMLDPMLFLDEVPKTRGSGKQWRGFMILRHSLFLSCVQDIAKLTLDDDKRTPSIRNLISAIDDPRLLGELREEYASWHAPVIDPDPDPEIVAALHRMELREELERRAEFDRLIVDTRNQWVQLSSAPYIKAMLTIRDKVAAHTEVQFVADKYQFVDVGALGLKWSELRKAIEEMQALVENLGLLIRNAGFAWDMLDEHLVKASRDFWLPAQSAT